MPIECGVTFKAISEDGFYPVDHEVMRLVFSMHSELGRFWDERIYQNELAYRCRDAGFESVATEVPIKVSYGDFSKFYYIDSKYTTFF